MTPDDESDLKESLMRADLALKTKQAFWETPRNLAIIFGAFAAIVATLAGLAGYKFGQQSATPTQIIFQPGSIVAPPSITHP
jgi:hypothetical protein